MAACARIQFDRKDSPDMQVKSYTAGETIIAEGTHGTDVFVVTAGEVLICKETGKKGRIPIATLGVGEVFGEMHMLDDVGFRSATDMAKTDVTLEIIPKDEMERHFENTPPIVYSILQTLSKRLAATSQENSILKSHDKGVLSKLFGK